jgi:TIR domain
MIGQVFLSHSTHDLVWAERLKASIEGMGVPVYLAEQDVRPGMNLAEKVTQAIDASEVVVVLISDNSVSASYVNHEIGCALKAKKVIIPLVQPGIESDKLGMLQGVEYIPFDFAHPHEGLARLRMALQRLVQEQAAKKQQQAAKEQFFVMACVVLALALVVLDS